VSSLRGEALSLQHQVRFLRGSGQEEGKLGLVKKRGKKSKKQSKANKKQFA